MEKRTIRNTQYPVQIPVVTLQELENLTPEWGAMILTTENQLLIGLFDGSQVAWKQIG